MCSPAVIAKARAELERSGGPVTRRRVFGTAGMAAAGAFASSVGAAQQATPVSAGAPGRTIPVNTIMDLTHTLSPTFAVFAGKPQFQMETIATFREDGFYGNVLTFEHSEAYMNSLTHSSPEGAPTADELPIENFIAARVVIDISEKAEMDDDAELIVDDIRNWESVNGAIPPGSFVAMYSGWESRIDDPEAFINLDADGVQHFTGIGAEAATFLVEERDIVGVGVDTVSLDIGASTTFDAHLTILGSGLYGLETLANPGTLDPVGTTLIVGGPKHRKASGGPNRVYAVF